MVEVSFNGIGATLQRSISDAALRPMRIFLGNMNDALKNTEDGWKQYPYRLTDNTFSFSRVLFDLLNYPEVRSDVGDTNITMHQILRLLFIDQESPTDSLFRFDRFDQPLTREAVSELLRGIYDNELYGYRLQEKNLLGDKKDKESEYKGLKRLYQDSVETIDLAKIDKKISDSESHLTQLEHEITEKSNQTRYSISRKRTIDFVDNVNYLNKLKQEISELKSKAQESDDDIADSKLFIESLKHKLDQINDSILTRQSLGELPLTHCPQCLYPLHPTERKGVCSLCHQPIEQDTNKTYASRLQQEIKMQIAESEKIIETKENRSCQYKKTLANKEAEANQIQRDINLSTRNSKPTGQEELEKLFERRGSLKQEIQYLKRQKQIAERYAQLGVEVAEIEKKLSLVKQKIDLLVEQQYSNRIKAMQKIHAITAHILNKDLPRQIEFQNAKPGEVDVNFKANSIALNGQFNYSASSNVYLKNASRFAIFYASLVLDFARYPSFIACDNMEDKGMEEERSHNFQKLLVNICSKFPKDSYQMIFTTSMIASELNTEEYCIGEEYTVKNKSLKI